ncbi:hypothetical protein HON22_03060 [Candidatus Peregrinibacteria bacterium]|jgi:hypothetical protein|nr:hypothetical protein [Candidatus Peregrinibacteria bacterium]
MKIETTNYKHNEGSFPLSVIKTENISKKTGFFRERLAVCANDILDVQDEIETNLYKIRRN